MKRNIALSRTSILDAVKSPLAREWVEVPEWGGGSYIKTLTVAEREAVTSALSKLPEAERDDAVKVLIVMATMVDETGVRLFPDFAEYTLLTQAAAAPVERLFRVADRLNSVTERFDVARKN